MRWTGVVLCLLVGVSGSCCFDIDLEESDLDYYDYDYETNSTTLDTIYYDNAIEPESLHEDSTSPKTIYDNSVKPETIDDNSTITEIIYDDNTTTRIRHNQLVTFDPLYEKQIRAAVQQLLFGRSRNKKQYELLNYTGPVSNITRSVAYDEDAEIQNMSPFNEAPDQREKPIGRAHHRHCGGHYIENGQTHYNYDSYTATCNDGYIMKGTRTNYCYCPLWGSCYWRNWAPTCHESCIVPLPNATLANATTVVAWGNYNDRSDDYHRIAIDKQPTPGTTLVAFKLMITCLEPYHKPDDYIICHRQTWNTKAKCYRICVEPEEIKNGNIKKWHRDYEFWERQHITITCDEGFLIDGNDYIECKNAEWNYPFPKCVQPCVAPPKYSVMDGDIKSVDSNGNVLSPKDEVVHVTTTITCRKAHMLLGPGTVQCSDNVWSDPLPKCVEACVAPPTDKVKNGKITYLSASDSNPTEGNQMLNLTLLIECNSDSIIKGHNVTKCVHGTWDHLLPECVLACVVPPADKVINGKLVYTAHSSKEKPQPGSQMEYFTIDVTCDKDYVPKGVTNIKCHKSKWTSSFPECIKLCEVPAEDKFKNAVKWYPFYGGTKEPNPGDKIEHFTLEVSCDPGYQLVGVSTVKCNRSVWDNTIPQCFKLCVAPPADDVHYGTIIYSSTNTSDEIKPGMESIDLSLSITCNKDYIMKGNNIVKCVQGVWDNSLPKCIGTCLVPVSKVLNGKMVYKSYSGTSEPETGTRIEHFTFEVTCDKEFVPTGPPAVKCYRGTWDNNITECVKLCDVPSKLSNARMWYSAYNGTEEPQPGNKIEYFTLKVVCDADYLLVGVPTVKCNRSNWDNSVPQCLRVEWSCFECQTEASRRSSSITVLEDDSEEDDSTMQINTTKLLCNIAKEEERALKNVLKKYDDLLPFNSAMSDVVVECITEFKNINRNTNLKIKVEAMEQRTQEMEQEKLCSMIEIANVANEQALQPHKHPRAGIKNTSCVIPSKDQVNNGIITYPDISGDAPEPGTEMLNFSLTVDCDTGYYLNGQKNLKCNRGVWDSTFPECNLPCVVPEKDKVKNGIITFPSYSDDEPEPGTELFDLTISITCNTDYVLSGHNLLKCIRGVWDNSLPECVGNCVVPPTDSVANGKIEYTSYSGTGKPRPGNNLEHFTFKIICNEEHEPTGPSTIKCHRGEWDNKIPECIRVCEVPSEHVVNNGRTWYTSYSSKQEPKQGTHIEHFTLKIACDPGYLMKGVDTVKCNRSIWDQSFPTCVAACVVPPENNVDNGIITYPTYSGKAPETGTKLMELSLLINCHKGYLMYGQKKITCVDGVWDYPLPECNAACTVPPAGAVMNGKIEYTSFSSSGQPQPGDVIEHFTFDIKCDENHVPTGPSTIVCQKGKWDNSIPECIKLCEVFPKDKVKNGKIWYSSFSGTEEPQPGTHVEHLTLKVVCDVSYVLVGVDTVMCNKSKWDNDIPECIAACVVPTADRVSNGVIIYVADSDDKLQPGNELTNLSLTVDCNEGYSINGQKELKCSRGVWDHSFPECYLPCVVPPKDKVKNGIITYPSHSGDEPEPDTELFELTLLVTCNENFILSGQNLIKCIRGVWDKSLPECADVCVAPSTEEFANGRMDYTSYSGTGKPQPGATLEHFIVNITCDEDYIPTGPTFVKCYRNVYDFPIPECIKLCKVPSVDVVKNGRISYLSYSSINEPRHGAEIEHFTFKVTCDYRHLLKGVDIVKCNRSIWDHTIPECVASCVVPAEDEVKNGIITYPSFSGKDPKPGTGLMDLNLLVNCNKGYLLYGAKEITCVNGAWDHDLPKCNPACIAPPTNIVKNGKLVYILHSTKDEPRPGDPMEHFDIEVICDEDYVHKGASIIVCTKSKWDDPFPECIKLCEVPLKNRVENGKIWYASYSGAEEPQPETKIEHFTFKVVCESGYLLVGVDTVMCNRSKWDNDVPECIAACVVPPVDKVANGNITYPGLSGNEPRPGTEFLDLNFTVDCQEGFLLNGQKNVKCSRGVWDNSFPECYMPCIVPPKDKVKNGIITYPSHSGDEPEPNTELFDITLLVTCNKDYVLSGQSLIQCIRGVWDKSLPECTEACTVPPVDRVANGTIVYTSYSGKSEPIPGTNLEYFTFNITCDKDHVPTGVTTIKCYRSVWDYQIPECIKLCKAPPANVVKNGKTWYSAYSNINEPQPGAEIEHFTLKITCDSGYILRGVSTVMCNRSIWDNSFPDCIASCVVPPKDYVRNGILTYPENSGNEPEAGTEQMDIVIVVKCNTGYILDGHKKITCIHSTWDYLFPVCYAACIAPPANKVINGKIKYTSYSSTDEPQPGNHIEHFTFDVVCDDGHVPKGVTTLKCHRGKWDNPIPECLKLCEVPTADKLKNARIWYLSYSGRGEPVPGTFIEQLSFKVHCESGYLMIGVATISCNRSIWDNAIPKCVAACIVPPDEDVNNGILSYPTLGEEKPKPGQEFLDFTISITCNKGYLLEGQNKVTCLHNVWDHSLPVCYEACVAPAQNKVINGKIVYKSYSGKAEPRPASYLEHFTLNIVCDATYVPTGATTLNCRRGKWNGTIPECIQLCEVLTADKVKNGKTMYPAHSGKKKPKPGLKIEYFTVKISCNRGYMLEGVDTLKCNRSKWDNQIPRCLAACTVPPVDKVNNGVIKYLSYSSEFIPQAGTEVMELSLSIKCNKGFLLNGQEKVSCSRGKWEYALPECFPACIVPSEDSVMNGIITYPSDDEVPQPGAELTDLSLTVDCNETYVLHGQKRVLCFRGIWDNPLPECVEGCLVPESIHVLDGISVYSSYSGKTAPYPGTYKEEFTITVACDEDYEPTGPTVITCYRNKWDNKMPECIKLCEAKEVRNARNWYSSYSGKEVPKPGTKTEHFTLRIVCFSGFLLRGETTVKCNRSIWDRNLPECIEPCVVPHVDKVKHGIITVEGYEEQPIPGTEFMELTLSVTCDPEYIMFGSKYVNCHDNKWDPFPECVEPCVVPPMDEVKNGRAIVAGYHKKGQPPLGAKMANFTLLITCNHSYVLWGSSSVNCFGNLWDPYPECVILCVVPPLVNRIKHGRIKALDRKGKRLVSGAKVYTYTLKITCNKGFKLYGQKYLRCKNNELDYPYPQCLGECPTLPTSTTTTTTTTVRTTVLFDIDKFLDIVSNLTYDYYTNLTQELNETLKRMSAPTPYTLIPPSTEPDYNVYNDSLKAKCFVCGMNNKGVPGDADCADAFAGNFIPFVPRNPTAKGKLGRFRKYCIFKDINNFYLNDTMPRMMFGRWTGGCSVRWSDLSGIYTERTCRSTYKAATGKSYASKRMAKLEMALQHTDNGCIISPTATLVPLSRSISLYSRFHVCVCTGNWCNAAPHSAPAPPSAILLALASTVSILTSYCSLPST